MNSQPSACDRLQTIDIFSALDEENCALIAERMKLICYRAADVIFREGDIGDRMLIIQSGRIAVTKSGTGGAPVKITTLQAGEVAGMMSIFDADVRSATLTAETDCDVLMLDKDTLQELLAKNTDLGRKFLSYLSRKLRDETSTVVRLLSSDVDSRFKVAFFDSKSYTKQAFLRENGERFALHFFEPRLSLDTVALTAGFQAVCAFVNDDLRADILEELQKRGVLLVALRSAGFNNVDLDAASRLGISVIRVPAYSPAAVAEHAVALLLSLNRKICRAYNRVREGNFSLAGLEGFDMKGKTAGIIGTGKIGKSLTGILSGFGMTMLGYDRHRDEQLTSVHGLRYVSLDELYEKSDVISLHAPLLPETRHLIDSRAIALMKPGVVLINTSRGALIDTAALIQGLKSEKIGAAGLDVYEEEEGYFFEDRSDRIITDDLLARLLTFPNVIITSHQAFLTREALQQIARVTLDGIGAFAEGKRGRALPNSL